MEEATIVCTEYMKYRLGLRGYNLATVEQILRYSSERNDSCDKPATNQLSN
jgi:hypothetical protein